MNGVELFRLGRRLTKIGVRTFPESDFTSMPTSVRMVLIEVFENPDTTIGQIVDRTGFPQSHVSAAVARLRELGLVITKTDPSDGRRTLVAPSSTQEQRLAHARQVIAPIESELTAELIAQWGPQAEEHLNELLVALETLNRLLVAPPRSASKTCVDKDAHRGEPAC